jgi:hypothetical protein
VFLADDDFNVESDVQQRGTQQESGSKPCPSPEVEFCLKENYSS